MLYVVIYRTMKRRVREASVSSTVFTVMCLYTIISQHILNVLASFLSQLVFQYVQLKKIIIIIWNLIKWALLCHQSYLAWIILPVFENYIVNKLNCKNQCWDESCSVQRCQLWGFHPSRLNDVSEKSFKTTKPDERSVTT